MEFMMENVFLLAFTPVIAMSWIYLAGLTAVLLLNAWAYDSDNYGITFITGLLLMAGVFYPVVTQGNLTFMTGVWAFCVFLGKWMVVGCAVSLVKLLVELSTQRDQLVAAWEKFVLIMARDYVSLSDPNGECTVGDVYRNVELAKSEQAGRATFDPITIRTSLLRIFDLNYVQSSVKFFTLVALNDSAAPLVKMNRGEIGERFSLWATLWPSVVIDLVFGKLLSKLFNMLSTVVSKISQWYSSWLFKGVFNVKD